MHFDQELDTCNLKCFMLTLRTKKTLNAMDSGMVLKVTAAVAEFTAYTKQTGDILLAASEANSDHIFYIRKK